MLIEKLRSEVYFDIKFTSLTELRVSKSKGYVKMPIPTNSG